MEEDQKCRTALLARSSRMDVEVGSCNAMLGEKVAEKVSEDRIGINYQRKCNSVTDCLNSCERSVVGPHKRYITIKRKALRLV